MGLHGSRTTVLLALVALFVALAAASPAPAHAAADLSVSLTVSPDPGVAGLPVTETATVTNDGDTAAADVKLLFLATQQIEVSSAQSCTLLLPFVLCPIGTLAPGASASRTVVFDSLRPGTLDITVSAQPSDGDPTPENNSVAASTAINPPPDLRLVLSSSPEPATVGADVTVSAAISNTGGGPAPKATFQLTLPAEATVASLPSGCAAATGRVACTLGTLEAGKAVTRDIVIRGMAEGVHTLLGSLTSSVEDLASANDRAAANVTVRARAAGSMPTHKVELSKLVTGLPKAGGCVRNRSMRLLIRRQTPAISAASVFVSGKRVRHRVGDRLALSVNLRSLPRRGFTLRVTDELTDGSRLTGQRRIRACRRAARR